MRRPLFLALLFLPIAASAVPLQLTHQGRLFDSAGAPLIDAHDLHVALYDAPAGGALQWSEDLSAVLFDQGYYTVDLGQVTPLDLDTLQGATELWMSLAVDSGPPVAQRLPLQSVPFALIAARADVATSVDGGTVNATALTVNGMPIVDPDGTIAWDRIVGAPTQLGDLGCASAGQIPQWNGSAWGCVAPDAHTHSADQITSGTLSLDVIPIGTSQNTVARGDHTHSALDIDLGPTDPSNPLNHDRYTDLEARTAVGPHYTDNDAITAVGPHYTDSQAIIAVGPHYTDSQAITAVGPHYTDAQARTAMGVVGDTNALNHNRYTNSEAVTAVGPHLSTTQAVAAVATADAYVKNTGDALTGGLTVDNLSATGQVSGLATWGLTSRTQGVLVYPEGDVYQNGGELTLAGGAIVMNPASGSYVRVKAGTYTLSPWGYLYVDLPPTSTRGSTITPTVAAWSDGDRKYDSADRLVLAQRQAGGTIYLNFAPPARDFVAPSSLITRVGPLSDVRTSSTTSAAGVWWNVPQRTLNFTKRFDTSALKVNYTDVLGTYGQYYDGCEWRVLLDGAQIQYFSTADQDTAGIAWTMEHASHIAWATGIATGSHTLQVQSRGNRGAWTSGTAQCLQGWNTTDNFFSVEEIP